MTVLPPMTDYFRKDVLAKRPYIQMEWCIEALNHSLRETFSPTTDAYAIGSSYPSSANSCA
jgi:hypothetical protein